MVNRIATPTLQRSDASSNYSPGSKTTSGMPRRGMFQIDFEPVGLQVVGLVVETSDSVVLESLAGQGWQN